MSPAQTCSREPSVLCGARRGASQRGGIIRRVLFSLFVLITLLSLYLLREPILRGAANLLIVQDPLEPADAIVVLGDDNYAGDRATKAAELFHARWAPVVVGSGRYLRPYASIADLMARDLAEHGVPADAIIPFRNFASSTRGEAFAIRRLAREKRWRRLIVVTSNYHTRRTRYVFHDVIDPDIDVRVVPAYDEGFEPRIWWHSRGGRKTFFREWAAFAVAIWEAFGDNEEEPGHPAALPPQAANLPRTPPSFRLDYNLRTDL